MHQRPQFGQSLSFSPHKLQALESRYHARRINSRDSRRLVNSLCVLVTVYNP